MDKNGRIKVLTISDHPMIPSGVGTQTRYVMEALLATNKFSVVSLAGAIKHPNYDIQKIEGYEADVWKCIPVDGYGNPDMLRAVLAEEKPDILWFMTDPRFYGWLWAMEDEIRSQVPFIYYHVWDNYPYPKYNGTAYKSTDVIASISKVTHDIVNNVAPEVENHYVPHAVDTEVFKKKMTPDQVAKMKTNICGDPNRFMVLWNNRNARRKLSGSLVGWFKEFVDSIDGDAVFVMHTDVRDQHGQPLDHLAGEFGLKQDQMVFSTERVVAEDLASLYGAADVTINIADAEGFGLGTLESLACETPIIVTMTGGLQEQVTDGENFFGVGIEPCSKAIVGSQQVPYIYEDRVSKEDVLSALKKIYNMTPEERATLGEQGRAHVLKNYGFEDFKEQWINLMTSIYENYGSWENRKNYKSWEHFKL